MYKQIAIAALIAGPLIADLAARHTGSEQAAMVATPMEVPAPPPGQSAPTSVLPPAQSPSMVASPPVPVQLNPNGGIDPTPALDPTPAGSGAMQATPPAAMVATPPPPPMAQEAMAGPTAAPDTTSQPVSPAP